MMVIFIINVIAFLFTIFIMLNLLKKLKRNNGVHDLRIKIITFAFKFGIEKGVSRNDNPYYQYLDMYPYEEMLKSSLPLESYLYAAHEYARKVS